MITRRKLWLLLPGALLAKITSVHASTSFKKYNSNILFGNLKLEEVPDEIIQEIHYYCDKVDFSQYDKNFRTNDETIVNVSRFIKKITIDQTFHIHYIIRSEKSDLDSQLVVIKNIQYLIAPIDPV